MQRQEVLPEQLRQVGVGVRFINAPVAEASAAFVVTFVITYVLLGVLTTRVYTWLFIMLLKCVCEMAAVIALTVEFRRMLEFALFMTGIAMAVRIVPTIIAIRSSGRV